VKNQAKLAELTDKLAFLETAHQATKQELEATKESKAGMQHDLIALRKAQNAAEGGERRLLIEVSDLQERLVLKQQELDTTATSLKAASEKVRVYDQVMSQLYENEE